MNIRLSEIDEKRFGYRAARAEDVRAADIPEMLAFADKNRVEFLYARCTTSDLEAVHRMERGGFELMDTLVYYRFDPVRTALPPLRETKIRTVGTAGDVTAVRRIAARAFEGYQGHYHADPRLEPAICDEVYIDWAVRSCEDPEVADLVLLAFEGGQAAGFLTLKTLAGGEVDGRLFAVDPAYQGRGVGQALLTAGLHWAIGQGAGAVVISTQVTNVRSQAAWVRVGFRPSESFYIFHKWFSY